MDGKITYRQQYTRCGKQRCRKCREGAGHGPYWYAYWSDKGRTVSKYVGIHLPAHVETNLLHRPRGEDDEVSPISSGTTSSPSPMLRVYLLGQFRIERYHNGEWQAIDSRTWHRRRARALLGCLLSNPSRRLGREQIMDLLWPDLDIDVAANRLNGAVHELRQILEPGIARPAASRMLRLERDVLELANRSQIWVDAEEFENILKDANTSNDPQRVKQLLEEAANLYHGHYLLEELYSEWAMQRRDALQRAWIGLLLKLAQIQAQYKEFASAIETLDRLRTADPSNETALQRLMLLLTQLDRRGEALQIYRQHVSMLRRDYECEPLPETTELFEKLRTGHIPTSLTLTEVKKEEEAKPALQSQDNNQVPKSSTTGKQEIKFTRPLFQLGRHNQSPLIGREAELRTMREVVFAIEQHTAYSAHAQAPFGQRPTSAALTSRPGQTHFLLLKGESGIGKTRLAEELSLEAYARGWTVAWSRSYEQESTIPYRPWTELLRVLFQNTTFPNLAAPDTEALTNQWALRLERLSILLPDLAPQSITQMKPTQAISHEQERLHLWEAALTHLEIFSRVHPLLLVLDDLHWADDSSIELLTYIIHHLQNQHIFVIGTCRDGELAPQHKLRALVADLQREQAISIVAVQPLTQSQIATLVSHLPHDIVESIQTQASGNPFFAEELARYVGTAQSTQEQFIAITQSHYKATPSSAHLSQGQRRERATRREHQHSYPGTTLPEAIAAVLERRLSRLSTECQTLLGKAAVLGGSFELNQLLPMTREQDEDTILDLLDEALSAGLLIEEGTGSHISYRFWHPLIIDHLYGRLSAARRAQLHRKAAEALSITSSTHPEKAAATIVYHLNKGGGDPDKIAFYAEMVGNQAYALAAYHEAQQYYLQVLQAMIGNNIDQRILTGDVHSKIQHILARDIARLPLTNPLHICRILERVAECSTILGNFAEGRQLYTCILELRSSERFLRQIYTSPLHIAEQQRQEAQIQALLWREIGNTWASTGEYEQAYICYGRGQEVMSKAGVTRGAAWACLHLQYGAMLRLEGKYHEARRYLQEALEMLKQVVTDPAQATPHERKTQDRLIENFTSPYTNLLQTRTERALKGGPHEIAYAHERLGIVAASLGELNSALEHLHTALNIYEQSERISEMARVCGNLGAAYITKGEPDAARLHLQRSLELARRGEDLPNMTFVMLNLGDVAQRSGELLEAESWYKQSLELSKRINDREHTSWSSAALASVQEDLGHLQEAAMSIRSAINIGRAIKSTRCIHYALVGLADIRITQVIQQQLTPENEAKTKKYLQRAKATLHKAIELAGMEVENIIEGKHLLALVYMLLGDLHTALTMAQETLREAQGHETAMNIGRAYRLLGRILTQQGQYTKAGYYFQQAIHVCQTHGLQLDYARALHNYGQALIKRNENKYPGDDHKDRQTTPCENTQRGIHYLLEARCIFTNSHAALDLALVKHDLEALATSNELLR